MSLLRSPSHRADVLFMYFDAGLCLILLAEREHFSVCVLEGPLRHMYILCFPNVDVAVLGEGSVFLCLFAWCVCVCTCLFEGPSIQIHITSMLTSYVSVSPTFSCFCLFLKCDYVCVRSCVYVYIMSVR
jgi:hypothetical protein